MLHKKTLNFLNKWLTSKRCFHQTKMLYEKGENPLWRTFRILKEDVQIAKSMITNERCDDILYDRAIPKHVDALIIGGGAMGSSVAYWLKEKTLRGRLNVAVIEKDPSVNISVSKILIYIKQFFAVFKVLNSIISGWFKAAVFSSRKHSNVFIWCRIFKEIKKKVWS